jgi:hypothetical protein
MKEVLVCCCRLEVWHREDVYELDEELQLQT